MACTHNDCLTCPYPDCISKSGPVGQAKRKPGRKKLDPEVKRLNKQRYQQAYYLAHKAERAEKAHEYYEKHAERIRKKQKEYRMQHSVMGKRIWMTDGHITKMVSIRQYDEYKRKGWKRGRTIAIGRIWINNEIISKMIYPNELEQYLEQGYKLGRLSFKRRK